jgi:hypothetical protein
MYDPKVYTIEIFVEDREGQIKEKKKGDDLMYGFHVDSLFFSSIRGLLD